MTHLLDTHALLWALTDPSRLGDDALTVITDASAALYVSAVSAWEISTKYRLGKLPQADAVLNNYERHLTRLGVRRVPITDDHALQAGRMDWEHRDPFDRMLAAQCYVESLTLITKDAVFEELTNLATIW